MAQTIEAQLCGALGASLDPLQSAAALSALKALEAAPDFSTALLRVTSAASVEHPTRQAAATYFKNLVKRAWVRDRCLAPACDHPSQHAGWRPPTAPYHHPLPHTYPWHSPPPTHTPARAPNLTPHFPHWAV